MLSLIFRVLHKSDHSALQNKTNCSQRPLMFNEMMWKTQGMTHWPHFKIGKVYWPIKVQWVSGIRILGIKMIIFESTLSTFEASFIFWGSWGSIKNWLELKIKPPLADLALLNPWNTLYFCTFPKQESIPNP